MHRKSIVFKTIYTKLRNSIYLQIEIILGGYISAELELVGFNAVDNLTLDKVRKIGQNLAKKYSKMFGEDSLLEFKIAIDKAREREKHTDYEIKVHLETTNSRYYASKTGWKLLDVVEQVLDEIERQIVEKKEKSKRHRKLPYNA